MSAHSASDDGPLSGVQTKLFLAVSSLRGQRALDSLLTRALIPCGNRTLMLSSKPKTYLPKTSPPCTIYWDLRFQHVNFGEYNNFITSFLLFLMRSLEYFKLHMWVTLYSYQFCSRLLKHF